MILSGAREWTRGADAPRAGARTGWPPRLVRHDNDRERTNTKR
ncbi:hypothetical protein FM119_11055 [Mycetocola reblochoni REB411]|uniref:Uncharacterized protein n=1 Tax=Mycetocola reblochoni REB411 TaxID=1255698 RepID=A0A1R4K334_9MICO|nr:hypothetical protein FM119_11055 [Mycetocola reblochoni REB411]